MSRRVLILDVGGDRLFGTQHEPARPSGIGVLLLSFGQQPRSWVGDLGAYTADRICQAGFSVFRFDMPGLGDSPGEVPVHLEVLWRQIQDGSNEATARGLVRALKERFGFKGMVVGGFCGGSVSAVYAVGERPKDVVGLILMEPEMGLFNTPEATTGVVRDAVPNVDGFLERMGRLKDRVRSPEAWLRLFSGKSDLRYWKGIVEYQVRRLRDRTRGEELPPHSNEKLIRAWRKAADAGLPVLVLSVGEPQRTQYYASYGFGPAHARPRWRQTWIEVPHTTHAMVAGGAKEAVPEHVERWLRANFP